VSPLTDLGTGHSEPSADRRASRGRARAPPCPAARRCGPAGWPARARAPQSAPRSLAPHHAGVHQLDGRGHGRGPKLQVYLLSHSRSPRSAVTRPSAITRGREGGAPSGLNPPDCRAELAESSERPSDGDTRSKRWASAVPGRVRSHSRFRNRCTKIVSKSGIKWIRGSTK
jgi:hypothetical protein